MASCHVMHLAFQFSKGVDMRRHQIFHMLCWNGFTHTHTGTVSSINFLQGTMCHVGWRQCVECLTAKEHLRAEAEFQRKKMRVNEVFFTHGDLVWVRKAHLRPRISRSQFSMVVWCLNGADTVRTLTPTVYIHWGLRGWQGSFTSAHSVLPCDMCFGSALRWGQCTVPQWWNLDTASGRSATRSSVTYHGWSFALRCLQTQWQGSRLCWGVGWFCRHVSERSNWNQVMKLTAERMNHLHSSLRTLWVFDLWSRFVQSTIAACGCWNSFKPSWRRPI